MALSRIPSALRAIVKTGCDVSTHRTTAFLQAVFLDQETAGNSGQKNNQPEEKQVQQTEGRNMPKHFAMHEIIVIDLRLNDKKPKRPSYSFCDNSGKATFWLICCPPRNLHRSDYTPFHGSVGKKYVGRELYRSGHGTLYDLTITDIHGSSGKKYVGMTYQFAIGQSNPVPVTR